MDNHDIFNDIQTKLPNIISHFRFMSPTTTTAEEMAVLDKGKLVVEKLGNNDFGLSFQLPDFIYNEIKDSIEAVENSLFSKAQHVFKYFVGTKVQFVRLKNKAEN